MLRGRRGYVCPLPQRQLAPQRFRITLQAYRGKLYKSLLSELNTPAGIENPGHLPGPSLNPSECPAMNCDEISPAGVQNPDIIGAQAQSPAHAQPWDYDGIANSKLPRASGTPVA